eukprot:TRINITY_DN4973_c0_g1_i1.p1 TRINITY_DN4973_c0_g1~~TRINITY_DN4973_c0_g1_i1.p1  ORF type:complete len:325 (+),score=63.90 TRINITY_DN4973_c0_g1_i1:165-1139(+)
MAVNYDKCIEQLMRGELLSESIVKEICEKMKDALIYEPNVQTIRAPVTVVGDVHGQLYDVLEIFKIGGRCPDTNYLFLGNYINRGYHSIETICLLICLKLKYPARITLLRGNHESRKLAQIYGFYGECVRKYGTDVVYKAVLEMVEYLPLAALIEALGDGSAGQQATQEAPAPIFALHGGIGKDIITVDQIKVVDRFRDIPPEGQLTDIVWADPDQDQKEGFNPNPRGVSCLYGSDAVAKFLKINKIDHIVRSNQLCMDGYQIICNGKLSTIFSAPNFCYRCGNVGCILEIDQNLKRHYNTFTASPENGDPRFDQSKELPDYFM